MASLLTHVLDIVYPPRCVGCGEFDSFICETCLDSSARATPPRCTRCWLPGREETCLGCYRHLPAFTAMRSAFAYMGTPRQAVHALKFDSVTAMAPVMGELMAAVLADWSPPVDTIVSVPLSGTRKRTRGYNQSQLLANEVAKLSGHRVETKVLKRIRHTNPQTDQPGEAERRLNIAGAFGPGSRPAAGSVLLLDDVATTGATLDACARVLLDNGADRVYALTFARAHIQDDSVWEVLDED
jgi:ComF family protein